MGLSVMDRILVKNLYFSKDYGAVRLINEFCDKEQNKSTLNDFIKGLKQTRKSGSGRPRTDANIDAVHELVLRLKQ